MAIKPTIAVSGLESGARLDFATLMDDFAAAWERGEVPVVEEYLDLLGADGSHVAAELIYREFCLAEANGWKPQVADYLARFPQHKPELERLMWLHGECSPSLLGRWTATDPACELPEAGDEIGPYLLRRELGRGAFARVFLAEETNLENRLVVLKVSTRMTREPWLLARVRHPHIVEIVSHATADDGAFHLLCMPFWGGATLAAVLSLRSAQARRPSSGLDLLADLDSVAAPEFPSVNRARPAREILAGLTYSQAVAWVGARLAEALDHAFSRDVAHGDVKPSNVLLSADANPMLLDFNLARDASPAGLSHAANDPGGTLAYMAPERLRALATRDPARDDSSLLSPRAVLGPECNTNSLARVEHTQGQERLGSSPHLSDIYSLGMVLLEALTGKAPRSVAISGDPDPGSDFGQLRAVAGAYAAARARGATAAIHESEAGGWVSIAPGLRAILERCLDPDSGRRYRRGSELAVDLDRWRADRPLVYTSEPFWGQTVPRWLRRQRRAVILTAAALSLLVGLASMLAVMVTSRQSLQANALYKLARHWDDAEARAYGSQRRGAPRFPAPGDHQVSETAHRALNDYNVLGPGDWRQRDDVRLLPVADREDLDLWLMEQAYRYCRSLDDRPELCRADWQRALSYIERLAAFRPLQAFTALAQRLRAKLGVETQEPSCLGAGSPALAQLAPGSSVATVEFPWLEQYLLGVAAEIEFAPGAPFEPGGAELAIALGPADGSVVPDAPTRAQRGAAQRALAHYRSLLAIRPDSYWGNYRSAVASFALDQFDEAQRHLERCLKRRPQNAVLHIFLAGCQQELGQFPEALEECNVALEFAPDLAEWYRSRAFIRAASGQTSGLSDDIQHFELLSHILPRGFWSYAPLSRAWSAGQSGAPSTDQGEVFLPAIGVTNRVVERPAELVGQSAGALIDPEEVAARAELATKIFKADDYDLSWAELGKILILDPNHIGVRMRRALQAIETRRFDEARRDLEMVFNHPGLFDYIRKNEPTLIRRFHDASRRYFRNGKVEEGRMIARRALDLSIGLKYLCGESHYNMARACAVSGRTDPQFIGEAADQLFHALHANQAYQAQYEIDQTFDAVRAQMNTALRQMSELHRTLDPNTFRKTLAAALAKAR